MVLVCMSGSGEGRSVEWRTGAAGAGPPPRNPSRRNPRPCQAATRNPPASAPGSPHVPIGRSCSARRRRPRKGVGGLEPASCSSAAGTPLPRIRARARFGCPLLSLLALLPTRPLTTHTHTSGIHTTAFRWWRIALAPRFVEPLCRIASLPQARSPATHGFSLSLSRKPHHGVAASRVCRARARACHCAASCRRSRRRFAAVAPAAGRVDSGVVILAS